MTGRIPLAGVIGHPIGHSKSPRLHGYWLKKYEISGHYVPMDVSSEDLETVLKVLPKAGFVGVNVTIPHKEQVLRLADTASTRAREIGAANTLVFRDGRIEADNSDGYGFVANLKQAAPDWRADQAPVMIFGAGGASRAVVQSLLEQDAPEIRLTNRTQARAEALANEFGPKVQVIRWDDADAAVEACGTVVNSTSLGMAGQPDFPFTLSGLDAGTVVTDLVYTPLQTPFLTIAGARGARCVDGLGMLLHQAVPGFERWFGTRPEVDADLRNVVLST